MRPTGVASSQRKAEQRKGREVASVLRSSFRRRSSEAYSLEDLHEKIRIIRQLCEGRELNDSKGLETHRIDRTSFT